MRRSPARGLNQPLRATLVFGATLIVLALTGMAPTVATAATPHDDPAPSQTTCVPTGAGTTCSNTFGGDTSWDPTVPPADPDDPNSQMGAPSGITPTVTLDQTVNLTNQMVHVSWTGFTPSVNDQGAPGFSLNETEYAVGIFECRTDNPSIGAVFQNAAPSGDCYTIIDQQFATAGVVNAVQTFTGADGTGSADFQVETSQENSFLGCDDNHPCSIVVVPNWGGNEASGDCTDHRQDPGGFATFGWALDSHIGAPCSWTDRIVVPVSFAPTPKQFCPASDFQFAAEGSPALERAMNQWRPAWCVQQGSQQLAFDYNSAVNEYSARSDFLNGGQALSSGADVALVDRPADAAATSASGRRFTYAPISVSGISIVYYVDDQNTGQPITNLKLDARLVAKLLTQSYALDFGQCDTGATKETDVCDPAVAGNPLDLFSDPEFQALNPEYNVSDFLPSNPFNVTPTFLPTVLAGDSDMTNELTRWIESDPDAAAFMAGRPDPWGMHVNTFYKGEALPLDQFLPEDPGFTDTPTPTGTMQLTWNPVTGLDNVVHTIADNTSSALTNIGIKCSDPAFTGGVCHGNWSYPNFGIQQLGARSLFAVVDQGSAAAFRFPTAQLVNPAGTAVAPTTVSMTAAVKGMLTNPDKITQFANFDSTSPTMYPLTTVEYAMVPTCGVSSTKAQAISRLLTNVATTAQVFGTDPGQLPPFGGYLALNAAQKAQTMKAASQVGTQSCTSPPPDTTVDGQTGSTVPAAFTGTTGPGGGSTSGGGVPTVGQQPAAGAGNGGATSPSLTVPGTNGGVPVGLKAADTGGFAGLVLPLVLSGGGLFLVIGLLAYLLTATGAGRSLLAQLRGRTGAAPSEDV
jgi:hypothetical protein